MFDTDVFVREAHWNYFDLYSDEVADFIYQKLAAAGCGESPDLWL